MSGRPKGQPVDDVEVLRAATREAHEAIKDLQSLLKDLKKFREDVHSFAAEGIESVAGPLLDHFVLDLVKQVKATQDDLEDTIRKRFDILWGWMVSDEELDTAVVLRALQKAPDKVVPALIRAMEKQGADFTHMEEGQEVPAWRPDGT